MRLSKIFLLAALVIFAWSPTSVFADSHQTSDSSQNPFQGFYGGLFIQHMESKVDSDAIFAGARFKWHTRPDGFGGGVVAGYDFSCGDWLVGVEGDFGLTGGSEDCITDGDTRACDEFGSTSHLRGRFGRVVHDNLLLFITGGLAVATAEHSDQDVDGSAGFVKDSKDKTWVGYSLGGGVEYALSNMCSLRFEYLYDDYGDETIKFAPAAEFGTSQDRDMYSHTFRFGIKFSF